LPKIGQVFGLIWLLSDTGEIRTVVYTAAYHSRYSDAGGIRTSAVFLPERDGTIFNHELREHWAAPSWLAIANSIREVSHRAARGVLKLQKP
jgi:hypothetical protein